MRCDQLQQRIDELLDRREDLRPNAEVAAHAAICADCRRLVQGYESMLLGLDVLDAAEPVDRFVERTVETVNRRDQRLRVGRRAVAALAIAAGLMLAVGPAWFAPQPASRPDRQPGFAELLAPPETFVPFSVHGRTEEPMAWMLHATGRNLASLPLTVRRVASHPETDRIVGHIRPLTAPMETAWEVLVRTWPGMHSSSAAIPEADTGYIDWQQAWHA